MTNTNQQAIQLNTLYKAEALTDCLIKPSISPAIWVNSGSVDIYGSDSATQPATLADMTLNTVDGAVDGKRSFEALTSYIAVIQNTGTSSEVVLSGVVAVGLGSIS